MSARWLAVKTEICHCWGGNREPPWKDVRGVKLLYPFPFLLFENFIKPSEGCLPISIYDSTLSFVSCKNPQEGVLYFISGLYKISVIFSLHWVFYNWHDPSGGNGQRSFMSWLRFHRTTAIFPFRLKPWLISHFYIWNNTVWNVIDINWNVSHHRCLHLSGILFLMEKKHGKV